MTVALDHLQIAIPAGGEDAARRFWSGLVGLEEIPKPADLASRGGLWLRLAAGIELHLGVDPDFHPAAKGHPGLRLDDFDALLVRLAAAGITATPEHDHRGRRRLHILDPFGNRIELIAA